MVTLDMVRKSDPYNTAYHYLAKKYGTYSTGFTDKFLEKLRRTYTQKAKNELKASATDNDKKLHLNTHKITDTTDLLILNLMQTFYLSYVIQKELFCLLVNENILEYSEN